MTLSLPFRPGEQYKLPVFYFMLNTAFASWQVLYNIHLDGIGYTSMQIGILNAVFISTSAIVVPFWGMIADRYGNNRIMLLLTLVCGVVVFLIGRTEVFHWMLMWVFLVSVFHQPSGALVDGMTMGFVRTNPGYSYGQFRLWGSAGWAVSSLAIGYLAGGNTLRIFTIASVAFMLLVLFNLLTLPARPVINRSMVNFKSFGVFFRNRKLLLFLVMIFLFGIAVSPLHQFINLYYRDLGAGNAFLGWVFFIQALFEIPTFLIGVRLMKRMKPERILLLSMSVSAVRMLAYGFIQSPIPAISLSLFHGITIAFFLIGVVEYVQSHTPDHLRTTGQALIWAFHFGAGVTVGNLVLGYLRDITGMHTAMHIHAALAAAVIAWGLFLFRKPSPSPKLLNS